MKNLEILSRSVVPAMTHLPDMERAFEEAVKLSKEP
jgi:hypothetical protein